MAGQTFQEQLKASLVQDLLCRWDAPDLVLHLDPYLSAKFVPLNRA